MIRTNLSFKVALLLIVGMSLLLFQPRPIEASPQDSMAKIGTTAEGSFVDNVATRLPNGNVLVLGGVSKDRQGVFSRFFRTVEVLDVKSRVWKPVKPMIRPRSGHASVLLPDGNVLFVGGYRENSTSELWTP